MRKMLSAALLMCIVVLLSTLMIPTVLPRKAKCPIYVEGQLTYIPQILDSCVCERENGVVDVSLETTEVGWWSGGFEGTSHDRPCRVVVHGAEFDGDGNIVRFKSRYYTGKARFRGEVTVRAGRRKRGRLVIHLVGKQDWPEGADSPDEWTGTWRILKGTRGLSRVRGFGTFWGPGFIPPEPGEEPEPGLCPYDGWIWYYR